MSRSWFHSRGPSNATIFGKWTLPAIAILVAGTYIVAGILLLQSARAVDARRIERTQAQLRAAIQIDEERLARALMAYANSGSSYRNLHLTLDLEWAEKGDNFGRKLYALLGIDHAIVVSHENMVIYHVREGQPDTTSTFPEGLAPVIASAGAEVVRGLFWVDRRPAFVGIAPITPGNDTTVTPVPGPPSRLVFVRFLSGGVLQAIGSLATLNDVHLVQAGTPEGPTVSIPTRNGSPFALAWTDMMPGKSVADVVAPWFAACGGALVLLTWLALGRAAKNAKTIERAAASMAVHREALLASEARFRDVADAASDWIWEADARLAVTYLSERFEALTGHSPARLLGQPLSTILHSGEGPLEVWASRAAQQPLAALRCRYMTVNGEVRICRVAAKAVRDPAGVLVGFRGTATDITAEVEAHRKVEHLALYDPLTSLPNRTLLMEFLAGALSGAREGKRTVALLRIDLINFKQVNERFGLPAGDAVLTETAQRLRQKMHDNDLVARLGADDFALVASGPSSVAALRDLCAALQSAVAQPIHLPDGEEVHVTCAIGVALAPMDTLDAEGLVRCAELALQHSKAEEPPGCNFFTADMNEQVVAKRSLEHDLRRTVGSEDFVLLFQPRFNAETLEMVSVEALVRWLHPRFGLLSPDQFIPLAESTGLIVPLGEWALRRACAIIAKWPDLTVSVNVSPVQFHQGQQLLQAIRSALKDSGLPPHRLELELTENVLLENTEKALDVLLQIKDLGVGLAMDDFGTGYSSLSYLRHFPFDRIKIDRRFVGDLDQSRDAQGIVEAILGLGRALGLAVTAEGVETAAQFAWLRAGGCDEVQGFHFARPISEADLANMHPKRQART